MMMVFPHETRIPHTMLEGVRAWLQKLTTPREGVRVQLQTETIERTPLLIPHAVSNSAESAATAMERPLHFGPEDRLSGIVTGPYPPEKTLRAVAPIICLRSALRRVSWVIVTGKGGLYRRYVASQERLWMSVRSIITSLFRDVAHEQQRKLPPLTDGLNLLQSGLDSLSFALIVARLEDQLGFDPFDEADFRGFPVTFGDFVRVYEGHADVLHCEKRSM